MQWPLPKDKYLLSSILTITLTYKYSESSFNLLKKLFLLNVDDESAVLSIISLTNKDMP